jgi:hypothetical protein|tara:strand:- start:199 stop:540 length:342 start_codon:yes stop_codon:yes gene_type:complete
MKLPNSLSKKLDTLISKRDKVEQKYTVIKKDLDSLNDDINYLKELSDIKPQILYNQGRDKKYIYGQIYWYSDRYGSKKKSYRFLIGKMSDKKSRKYLSETSINIFLTKVIPST